MNLHPKPCPFCDTVPEVIRRGNEHTKTRSCEVMCKKCNVVMRVGAVRFTLDWCEETVLKKWNNRPFENPEFTTQNNTI